MESQTDGMTDRRTAEGTDGTKENFIFLRRGIISMMFINQILFKLTALRTGFS